MQQILQIVLREDEITWRQVLLNLVKSKEIDPWDVDLSLLASEYLKMLKKLKELDFKVSGKVILAAALLLRIKSERLLEEDIAEFDSLMTTVSEEDIEEFYNDMELGDGELEDAPEDEGVPQLIPRMPQLKKRRVSVYDLIDALEGALETRTVRKNLPKRAVAVEIPDISIDISALITRISAQLGQLFEKRKKISFSELCHGTATSDRVLTFLPLLHLAHIDHRLVDLKQDEHFGEIYVTQAKPVVHAPADEQEE